MYIIISICTTRILTMMNFMYVFSTGAQRSSNYKIPNGAWNCKRLEWYGENLAVHLFQRPTTNLFRRGIVQSYMFFFWFNISAFNICDFHDFRSLAKLCQRFKWAFLIKNLTDVIIIVNIFIFSRTNEPISK